MRAIALVIVALLAFSSLSGCSKDDSAKVTDGPTTAPTPENSGEDLKAKPGKGRLPKPTG